jgi:tripartite-type tricarboxylate transporter receptor subunit TctC
VNLNFNFIRDTAPVAGIFRGPYVMLVHPSVHPKTIPEFITYAKSNRGKLNMGSSGTGTGPHVAGELFKMMTGVNMVHVPYRGGAPALADLLGGQVQVVFGGAPESIGFIRTGKLRAIAVTTAARSEVLPEVPTVGEFVTGYEASGWYGIAAPKDTPVEIVNKLNTELNAGLIDPKMKTRLTNNLGGAGMPMTPTDFGKLIADETEKWGKVIKFAGIKPE